MEAYNESTLDYRQLMVQLSKTRHALRQEFMASWEASSDDD